jgi:hypothetical protein
MKTRPILVSLTVLLTLGGCLAKSDHDARDELAEQQKHTDALMRQVLPLFVRASNGELDRASGGFTSCLSAPVVGATYEAGAGISWVRASVEELDAALTDAGWEHVDVDNTNALFDVWDIKKGDKVLTVSYRQDNPRVSFGVANDCVKLSGQDLQDEFIRRDPTVYTAP